METCNGHRNVCVPHVPYVVLCVCVSLNTLKHRHNFATSNCRINEK